MAAPSRTKVLPSDQAWSGKSAGLALGGYGSLLDSLDGPGSGGMGAVDSIPILPVRSRAFQRDVGRPASVRSRPIFLTASSCSLRAASSARFPSRSDRALPNTSAADPTGWSRHSHAGDSVLSPLTTSGATAILNSGPYVPFVDFDALDPSLSGPRCLSAHCRGIRTESQTVSKNRQPHYLASGVALPVPRLLMMTLRRSIG